MKKIVKWLCIILSVALVLTALYFVFAFLGNPVSYLLTRWSANRYMEENFADSTYRVQTIGYNFKTGGYYAHVSALESQDCHFTVYFDGWGKYQYDTYESILDGSTTFARLRDEYWQFVKSKVPDGGTPFDISICYGDLKDAGWIEVFSYTDGDGNTVNYTLDKEYGLDRATLVLDEEYDIPELGRNYGRICLYIHDPQISVERAAELLLEVKQFLDTSGVPFYAIDFNLCEPRNKEGQNVGEQISLNEFLYSDIYKEGLIDRVQEHWDIAKEHHAIQDGLKKELELISSTIDIDTP